MKQLLLVVCVLVLSAQSVTVSSTHGQQTSLESRYSSFWEYLLEQEKTLTSFTEGKIWSDCTKPSDHGKIIDITLTPNPPKKGSDLVINASLSIDEQVTSGQVNAVVLLGSLPYQQSYDLCDLLKDVNIPCPVSSGKINFGIKLKVPEFTPSGDYSGRAIATDQNNRRLFCVNLKLHLD